MVVADERYRFGTGRMSRISTVEGVGVGVVGPWKVATVTERKISFPQAQMYNDA